MRVGGYDFVWDDTYYIVENTSLTSLADAPKHLIDAEAMAAPEWAGRFRVYRPLRNLSYLIDYQLFGYSPRGWHLHNLLLHLLNGLLVYVLGVRLTGERVCGLAAAAFFCLHPVQTEAVAWVKCRDDLLGAGFSLLGAVWLLGPGGMIRLGGSHLLACLAKVQTVIVLPGLLVFRKGWAKGSRARVTTLCGISVLYLLARHAVMGGSGQGAYPAGGLVPTMVNMGPVLLSYAGLILWPSRQLADYVHLMDTPVRYGAGIGAWMVILLGVGLVGWRFRRNAPLMFALVWVGAAMLPVMNLVPMMQYMAERFLYIPMVGVSLTAGVGIAALWRRAPRLSASLAGAIALALVWRTHTRLPVWANEVALFSSVVADAPTVAYRPWKNYLTALLQSGNPEEADAFSQRLLRQEWTDLQRADALHLRSRVLRRLGRPAGEQNELLEEVLALNARHVEALSDLGVLSAMSGDPERAVAWFTRAIEIAPGDANLYRNRGLARRELGMPDAAEKDFTRSLEIEKRRDTFLSLASLLWSQERFTDAHQVYGRGLEEFPGDPEMKHWRARAKALAEETSGETTGEVP